MSPRSNKKLVIRKGRKKYGSDFLRLASFLMTAGAYYLLISKIFF